jgi:hypothetical protein
MPPCSATATTTGCCTRWAAASRCWPLATRRGSNPCRVGRVTATPLVVGRDLLDPRGLLTQRYDGRPGTVYLIRPDQHVAARWRFFDAAAARAALQRALAA